MEGALLGDVVSLISNAPEGRDESLWNALATLNPSIVRPLSVEAQMSSGPAFGDPKDTICDVADARVTLCRESVIKHIQSNGVEPVNKYVASRYNGVAIKTSSDIEVFADSLQLSTLAGLQSGAVVTVPAESRINVFQSPFSNQFHTLIPEDAPMDKATLDRLLKEARTLFSTRDLTLFNNHKKMNHFGDRVDGLMLLEKTLNILLAAYAAQYFPSDVAAVASAHVTSSGLSTGTEVIIQTVAYKLDVETELRRSWTAFHYVNIAQVESVLKVLVLTRVRVAHSQPLVVGNSESELDDELAVLGPLDDSKVAVTTQQTKEQTVMGSLEDQLTSNTAAVASLICSMVEEAESTGIMPALGNVGASNAVKHATALLGAARGGAAADDGTHSIVGVNATELATVYKKFKASP